MAVSGWDMAARAPKPTTLTVVPGSVYFFERVDGKVFSEDDARLLWLSVHGARADEGFGRVVPGVWKPRKI
jgi:CRISPR/Cas system CMR-associated protein Cmr3 (group 5 of RAMP superfamily)